MESIGLTPGFLMALFAGSAEFFGGLFILPGLLTRLMAIVHAVTMAVAILTVQVENALFMTNNRYEFGLFLFASSLSLACSGAGKFTLDSFITKKRIK